MKDNLYCISLLHERIFSEKVCSKLVILRELQGSEKVKLREAGVAWRVVEETAAGDKEGG